MVALLIILVALLGLVQAAFLSIDTNLKNLIRDEAVRLAEQQMNVFKSQPINDTPFNPPATSGLKATGGNVALGTNPIVRSFGAFQEKYYVFYSITDLTTDSSKKSIVVYVGWSYKMQGNLQTPTNQEYQYQITSIVSTTS